MKVYLDHSATTPVDTEVAKVMYESMLDNWGNPSSVHGFGREARKALELAREKIAHSIGAEPMEIFFTSGGTEADNWAIKGIAESNEKKGKHIITSAIEHHAVMDACKYMAKRGWQITFVPVDEYGMVNVDDVAKAITNETVLISIMHANNEVGTIQPVEEIGKLAKEKGIYFHVDAVQTVGKIPVDVKDLNCDLLSIAAHKIYGPKGIGCLYIRKGTRITPFIHGGAQERKRRAGTENIPGIIGFGRAIEKAVANRDEVAKKEVALRDKIIKFVNENIPDIKLNGHSEKRLPNNVNFSFRYIEGESLLLSLDMRGIGASSGSACTSGSLDPSHVLLAMGLTHEVAHGSLRLTLGKDNNEEEIDYLLQVLPEIVDRLRAMSPLYAKEKGVLHNV